MNMDFLRKLPTPLEIKKMYPISKEIEDIKKYRDEELKNIFLGKSNKFILVVGPCSADREDAVLEYTKRLKKVYELVKDVLFIIPRVYTNKPRTKGDGYKGMLHQPDPNQNPDMLKGLIAIRKLHMDVIKETGFTCADEMLYPENHRYLSDLLSYVAVGARSVENQQHRLTASGLDLPVGMKNPTSGDLSIMMNAINASQHSHTFLYRGWEVVSKGNLLSHAILRGYVDSEGISYSNYHYEDLKYLCDLYEKSGFVNPAVLIDTNHNNSNKDYLKQIDIALDVIASMQKDEKINNLVKGLMIESYLEDGCQNINDGVYGKSITDPCLGWEKTEKLILEIANKLREIRK